MQVHNLIIAGDKAEQRRHRQRALFTNLKLMDRRILVCLNVPPPAGCRRELQAASALICVRVCSCIESIIIRSEDILATHFSS